MFDTFLAQLIVILIVIFILLYPIWRIFRRAGLNPALSFFLFIPGIGGLIIIILLAFSRWPNVEPNSGD